MWRSKVIAKHIPIDIVGSILMQMNPKDAVRLSTACKEWRVTTPLYDPTGSKTPWLFTMIDSKVDCILCNVVDDDKSFKIKLPSFVHQIKFVINGSTNGWLVLGHNLNTKISLLNPFSQERVHLPSLNHPCTKVLYMSSSPTNHDCILLGCQFKDLHVWRPGDKSWNVEKNVSTNLRSILSFQGQFYALDYPSGYLVTFQVLPVRIKNLDVPPPIDFFHIINHGIFLVESYKEILLVCLLVQGYELDVCDVCLFRLDLEKKTWIKMENLGDRVLFLNENGHQTFSVSAHAIGCHGNCIYLIDRWSNHAYIIKNGCVKRIARQPQHCRHQFWITPSFS